MTDSKLTGKAIWYVGAGQIDLRRDVLKAPGRGEVVVEATFSGVSRGTERLILAGEVPKSEWARMRAPLQEGEFPFPVKYGYSVAGTVVAGEPEMIGSRVFVLHPHQDRFVVSATMAVPIPGNVPSRRATLAANMETALNAMWDAGAGPSDRIVIVGGGIIGLLVAYLAARMPGADVTVIDPAPQRQRIVEALGARSALGLDACGVADVVFHTSASGAGLETALEAAAFEATVVDMSWYGSKRLPVALGGAFHSQRLRLISSQVGSVSPSRRARWTARMRLEAALKLLHEPVLDGLVETSIAFDEAPRRLPELLAPGADGLAPVICYGIA